MNNIKRYKSRTEYLISLAENYGVHLSSVLDLTMLLGDEEDFDALVSMVSEISEMEEHQI